MKTVKNLRSMGGSSKATVATVAAALAATAKDDALVRKVLRELQPHAPYHVKLLRGAITRIKRRRRNRRA
jgi:hypothetical protein